MNLCYFVIETINKFGTIFQATFTDFMIEEQVGMNLACWHVSSHMLCES